MKIAGRIGNVTNANVASAVRAARTMATECQNAGRVQAMTAAIRYAIKNYYEGKVDVRRKGSHVTLFKVKAGE